MKDNLGQECVKGGLLSFQGKIKTIASADPPPWYQVWVPKGLVQEGFYEQHLAYFMSCEM